MLASIMMVTYNRLELTKKTLNDLWQTADIDFELIIVDNGSTDGTQEYLDNFCNNTDFNIDCPQLKSSKIIKNNNNLGIAKARNQALKEASGDWLVTIDNDVVLPQNWLSECINILNNNKNYASIGVNFEKEIFPIFTVNNCEFQIKNRGNLGTACMVFSRSLHKLLGYFNTEYGLYGMEDSDWGMRIRVLGLKLGYIKENGIHLGEGEQDIGPYRVFKTTTHDNNLKLFNENCRAYATGKKPIYIEYKT